MSFIYNSKFLGCNCSSMGIMKMYQVHSIQELWRQDKRRIYIPLESSGEEQATFLSQFQQKSAFA
jgi:hypothetical protein